MSTPQPPAITWVIDERTDLDAAKTSLKLLHAHTGAHHLTVLDHGAGKPVRRWLRNQHPKLPVHAATPGQWVHLPTDLPPDTPVIRIHATCLVTAGWLEALAGALADGAALAGPRLAHEPGPQGSGAYLPTKAPAANVDEHARTFAAAASIDVESLATDCVAAPARVWQAAAPMPQPTPGTPWADVDLACHAAVHGPIRVAPGYVHRRILPDALLTGAWTGLANPARDAVHAQWGTAADARLRPLLTAALIARNEADALPETLGKLAGLVDAVVVNDTGSTDGTAQIARAYGAHVVETTWPDSFAQARNTAREEVTSPWCLSIDADEHTDRVHIGLIRAVIAIADPDLGGFDVPIRSYVDADHRSDLAFEHTVTRLFRTTDTRWVGRIHEMIRAGDGSRLHTQVLRQLALVHTGYVPDRIAGRDKITRNLHLAELDYRDETVPLEKRAYEYGRALILAGRLTDAVTPLQESVDAMLPTPSPRNTHLLAAALLAAGAEDATGRVLDLTQLLTDLDADTDETWLLRARAHLTNADNSLAREALHRALASKRRTEDRRVRTLLIPSLQAAVLAPDTPDAARDQLMRLARAYPAEFAEWPALAALLWDPTQARCGLTPLVNLLAGTGPLALQKILGIVPPTVRYLLAGGLAEHASGPYQLPDPREQQLAAALPRHSIEAILTQADPLTDATLALVLAGHVLTRPNATHEQRTTAAALIGDSLLMLGQFHAAVAFTTANGAPQPAAPVLPGTTP